MNLFGIALLPTVTLQKRIIRFRENCGSFVDGPILGTDTNIPHVSILQCPYFTNTPHRKLLREIGKDSLFLTPTSSHFSKISYQPIGWLFANVVTGTWLPKLQEICLSRSRDYIDVRFIDRNENFSGYSLNEKENYLKFGYRYVGKSFKPHVTIGRSPRETPESLPARVESAFNMEFAGDEVIFDKLVFYRAGEFGALSEILESVNFQLK